MKFGLEGRMQLLHRSWKGTFIRIMSITYIELLTYHFISLFNLYFSLFIRTSNLPVVNSFRQPPPLPPQPSSSQPSHQPKSPSPSNQKSTNSLRNGASPTATKLMPPEFALTWSPLPDLPRVPTVWRTLERISRRRWLTLWVITGDFLRLLESPVSRLCIPRSMFWQDTTPVMDTSTLCQRRGGRGCTRNMLRLTRVLSVAVKRFVAFGDVTQIILWMHVWGVRQMIRFEGWLWSHSMGESWVFWERRKWSKHSYLLPCNDLIHVDTVLAQLLFLYFYICVVVRDRRSG